MEGWYYLQENGELLYKRELGETAADLRESSFARALWPMEPSDREGAWNILVEGLAAGANPAEGESVTKYRMVSARELIGRKIVGFDPHPSPDDRGGTAHSPTILLDDGSVLWFSTEETESGEYGTFIGRTKKQKP